MCEFDSQSLQSDSLPLLDIVIQNQGYSYQHQEGHNYVRLQSLFVWKGQSLQKHSNHISVVPNSEIRCLNIYWKYKHA